MSNKLYNNNIHNKKNYNIIKEIIKKDLFHNYNTKLLKISNKFKIEWSQII